MSCAGNPVQETNVDRLVSVGLGPFRMGVFDVTNMHVSMFVLVSTVHCLVFVLMRVNHQTIGSSQRPYTKANK